MNGEQAVDPVRENLKRLLEQALRDVAPHMDVVTRAGRDAFTWRTVDEELLLAELEFDSAGADTAAPVRGPESETRALMFRTSLQSVELEVAQDRVMGEFVPACPGEVEVEGQAGVLQTVLVDDLGFFVIEPVPNGEVRLRCTTSTARLITEWIRF